MFRGVGTPSQHWVFPHFCGQKAPVAAPRRGLIWSSRIQSPFLEYRVMNTNLVTVFGGSGFLGRHTVRALARAGWRIKVATRHPARGFFLRPLGAVGQIDFVKCDVSDAASVAQAIAGAQAVVNLTGILFEKGQTFEDVQADGAANIAQAAAAAGV